MGMAWGLLIIQAPLDIHFMEGPSMSPSSGQAVEGFHGVVAVAGYSVVGEESVVGDGTNWDHDGIRGDQPKPSSQSLIPFPPH
jgi:hypothetical protein